MIPNNAASIVAFGLAVHALTPAAAAQAPAPAQDETTTAIGDQIAAASANAYLWPQDVTSNGKTYRVFQPRVTGLDGARAYLVTQVSMTGADGKPTTGEALLQAEVMTSDVPGEVELNQFTVRSFTIDGKPATDADRTALSQSLFVVAMTTTRPTLLQDMRLVNGRGSSTPGLCADVPPIVVTNQPTLPIFVDGEPRLVPIGTSGWMSVANTPHILLKAPDGQWWTRIAGKWYISGALMQAFTLSGGSPAKDVITAMRTSQALAADIARTPQIVRAPKQLFAMPKVVTKPTVFVSIDGAPQLADVCPGVQCVKNTNSILLTLDGSSFYLLASGRWFRTTTLGSAPWTMVAPADVPQPFAKLPRTRRYEGARCAVPGTAEANESVLAAREIRTVTLNRGGAQPKFTVAGGMPQDDSVWKQVDGTSVKWLPGASQPLLMVDGKVYCCDSGAWFTAPAVPGPWAACDNVPAAIYALPPSCPVYACTYVWVFGSTPDTVTYGFSPGYLGTYLRDGTPVYGTGFTYATGTGPSYQPYPLTYGFDAGYDSQTGTFAPPDDPTDDYQYYGAVDVSPMYMGDEGWTGWGWCSGWDAGWGYGMNNWWGWSNWGWWMNHWHPYYSRWAPNHADWEKSDLRDAQGRLSQRNKALDKRTWAPARGSMADAGKADIRSAGNGAARRDTSEAAARENQQAIDRQFQGAAADSPAAFRGPGNEYTYDAGAYRPWTGMGSNLGGNWGYYPLASPNGFHPPQQFIDPGAYWGMNTRLGNNVGVNAGPYHSPMGHGGWGTYDHWAGEGIRGTEYGNRGGGGRGR
jgi:hypothetical protein